MGHQGRYNCGDCPFEGCANQADCIMNNTNGSDAGDDPYNIDTGEGLNKE